MTAKDRTKLEATNGEVVSLVDDTDGLVLTANYYGKGSPCRTRFTVGQSLDYLGFQVPILDAALPEARESGCQRTQSSRLRRAVGPLSGPQTESG